MSMYDLILKTLAASDCNCKPGDDTCKDWTSREARHERIANIIHRALIDSSYLNGCSHGKTLVHCPECLAVSNADVQTSHVNVMIDELGRRVWVCTEHGTMLRVKAAHPMTLDDRRINTVNTDVAVSFEVIAELKSAKARFADFHSAHEGYGVILEELDELWDEIKRNHPEKMRAEAIQVGAMALRFVLDVCDRVEK